ncbi:MAG TPA: FtsX-like permease family protein, partial [Blastocatellia bacterium]|nr:FtsX-like permease family protein [Blastocatellia bacterium]
MKFALQMALRELRSSWRRLLFFFLCIAIGVGSIVALRSIIQNASAAVASEARALLTADVQIDSDRPWSEETLAAIDRIARPPLVERRAETIEASTMIRPADSAREGAMMIELKGIESPFPLVGEFKLASGEPFDYSLLAGNGAVVSPALLDRLSLRVGDEVRIGNSTFQIRGAVMQEPGGGGGGFRLGPRVFIERGAVEATGLTGFGSRARRKIQFLTPEGQVDNLSGQLREALKNNLVNVRSYKNSQENLNEQFTRTENYLSLTGLIILVLGGIGISNVTRVFIEQKKKTIAVLKCVGATGGKITVAYLGQVIALGLAGSILGVLLAKLALSYIGYKFVESLPPNMNYGLRPGAIAQGLSVGILISILFSALPLLRIRNIKPNVLLREDAEGVARSFDVTRWVMVAMVVAGLLTLVSWQAGSLRVGAIFLAGLALTAGVLHLAAVLLIALVRRARHVSSFEFRQAINSLYRPGNQTRVIVMVVGLGVFLVIATQSLQSNLLQEFDLGRRGNLPNMYLIDIQKDQEQGVKDLLAQTTGAPPVLVPTVRARIVAIDDRDIDLEQQDMKRERGRLGREYVLTYRPNLEPNETIVGGQFWDDQPSPEPQVSIEESMRGLAGLDVGGTITFDIQGRRIPARVTSIRRVDWRNARTGFMVVFRPGTLENAPQMLIGAINGPTDEVERSRFQRVLLDKYPNISMIDVTDIVRSVKRIIDNVTLAVTFVGGFVFLSGALILIGSIAMTKFQRVYEAAVLKMLGAKRRTLLLILLGEYSLLGLVAGVIGSISAVGLSYAAAKYIFEIPWSFTP